jgi:hypothetical protein
VTTPQGTVTTFSQTAPPHANPERLVVNVSMPGTYTVEVAVNTDPLQCKDSNNNPKSLTSASVTIPVTGCCPTGTLKGHAISPCQWFFEADVTNPNNLPLTFDWAFHDGTTKQTQWPQNTTTHTYAPGSITTGNATVTVSAPGCTPLVLTKTVTHTCGPCPTVTAPTATVSGTSPNASATFTTSVTPAGAATAFDWTVTTPGGAVFTKTTSAPTTTDGTADGAWTNTATGSTGPLDLSAAGSYSVAVVARGAGIAPSCPSPTATAFSVTTGPVCPPGQHLDAQGNCVPDSDPCAALLWVAIVLMAIGGLLVILGCLLVKPYPNAAGVLTLIGWIVFGVGWLLFLLWLLLCRNLTTCSVILAVRAFVGWLIVVFLVITAIIAFIALFYDQSLWPCAGLATLFTANFGFVYWIINQIAQWRGCLIENPGGSASSSASALTLEQALPEAEAVLELDRDGGAGSTPVP